MVLIPNSMLSYVDEATALPPAPPPAPEPVARWQPDPQRINRFFERTRAARHVASV
jgi:hypothetical protein